MEDALQITELELDDNSGHKLKIIGTKDEKEAREAAQIWAEENNCLVNNLTQDKDGNYFIAAVCSDDYE